jgi:hypothetical protein
MALLAWRQSNIVAATVLGATLFVASCGASSSSNSVAHLGPTAPTTQPASTAQSGAFPNPQQLYSQAVAYAICMRAHGDPGYPDPVLVNSARARGIQMGANVNTKAPQYRSANNSCKHLLPNDGEGPTHAQIQQGLNQLLKFAKCMRSHGVPSFPDPTVANGGQAIGFGGVGADADSSQFKTAQRACAHLSALGAAL